MIDNKPSQKIFIFKARTLVYLSRSFLGLVFPFAVLGSIFNPQVLEAANFPVILTLIVINIFFYHLFLAVAGLPIAILLLLAHIFLTSCLAYMIFLKLITD